MGSNLGMLASNKAQRSGGAVAGRACMRWIQVSAWWAALMSLSGCASSETHLARSGANTPNNDTCHHRGRPIYQLPGQHSGQGGGPLRLRSRLSPLPRVRPNERRRHELLGSSKCLSRRGACSRLARHEYYDGELRTGLGRGLYERLRGDRRQPRERAVSLRQWAVDGARRLRERAFRGLRAARPGPG